MSTLRDNFRLIKEIRKTPVLRRSVFGCLRYVPRRCLRGRMVFLRGHHLICLNFISGKGYDEVFVDNLKNIMERIDTEVIKITDGPDDVCKSCPYHKYNRCLYDEDADREVKDMDRFVIRLLNVKNDRINWREIKNQIPLVFSEWYKTCCLQCDWLKVCNENELFKSLKEI